MAKRFKWTLQDMNSIAEFNRVVKNYIKMTKLLNEQNFSYPGITHSGNGTA